MLKEMPRMFGILTEDGIEGQVEVVEKKWGKEYILPNQVDYTTKFMEVKPGSMCSLHFHKWKNETFVLIKGELIATYFTRDGEKRVERLTRPFDSLILPNCTPHTFSVPPGQEFNTIFIESSTTDNPEDSYRVSRSTSNVEKLISNR